MESQRKIFVPIAVSLTAAAAIMVLAVLGAAATMTVQSVFENVDINSSDETRFNPSIRAVLTSMLRAFNVPDQVLENCRTNAQGISATISGTSVSCRFVGRPATNGGLAQFTLNLTRQL